MATTDDNLVPIVSKDEMGQHLETGLASSGDGSGLDAGLTPEHRHYLVEKHGTAELDPVPCLDDADPLNWPKHRARFPFSFCPEELFSTDIASRKSSTLFLSPSTP